MHPLIEKLDELKSKATPGPWETFTEPYANGWSVYGVGTAGKNNKTRRHEDVAYSHAKAFGSHESKETDDFIVALVNNYEQLKALIEGVRVKESYAENNTVTNQKDLERRAEAGVKLAEKIAAGDTGIAGEWIGVDDALSAYHSAIKDIKE